MDVYYFIPGKMIDNVIGCGLKLSEWFEREVPVNGEIKKCIPALLNPKDDITKFKSPDYKCLKLAVNPDNCYIADRFLYETSQISDFAKELYNKSIITADKYIFGTYRLPECLIFSTLLEEQIDIADKRMDFPILFENSEKLYVNNIIESYREENENFSDVLLYYLYNTLAESKIIDKIEDKEKGTNIFFERNSGKTFCVRFPKVDTKSIILSCGSDEVCK